MKEIEQNVSRKYNKKEVEGKDDSKVFH